MIRARHIVPLAAVCTAAGLGAASLASGAKDSPRPSHVVRAPVVVDCGLGALPTAARPGVKRAPAGSAPAAAKPSAKLLGAFGVLRRPRAATDTLPQAALQRLRATGARFDPEAARLLRTTPRGGRAWIVPIADLGALTCGLGGPGAVLAVPPVMVLPSRVATRPATRAATRRRLRALRAARRLSPVPAQPAPSLAPAQPARPRLPQEGVAVVALGDAPGGGGGTLSQLLRARATPSVEPCSGPGGELVAVSGVAPDGITEAYLTSPDGSAIKTDVKDNAYSFIVPPTRSVQPRYVVWMKRGLPQVSPVQPGLEGWRVRVRCTSARSKAIRLSPSNELAAAVRLQYLRPGLTPATPAVMPFPRRLAVPAPVPSAPRGRRAVPAPPAVRVPAAPAPSAAPAPAAPVAPPVTHPRAPSSSAPAPARPAAPAPAPAPSRPAAPAPSRPAAPAPAP